MAYVPDKIPVANVSKSSGTYTVPAGKYARVCGYVDGSTSNSISLTPSGGTAITALKGASSSATMMNSSPVRAGTGYGLRSDAYSNASAPSAAIASTSRVGIVVNNQATSSGTGSTWGSDQAAFGFGSESTSVTPLKGEWWLVAGASATINGTGSLWIEEYLV